MTQTTMEQAVPARRLPAMRRRVRAQGKSFWTVGDQILSSGSNFLLTLCVARTVSPHDVGVFAIVYGTYLAALGCSRSVVSDIFMMAHTIGDESERRELAERALLCAMGIGCIASLWCCLWAAAFGGALRSALLCLAVVLPALFGQDFLRFYFFVINKSVWAVVSDAVWVAAFLFAVIDVELTTSKATLWELLLVWGVAGVIGGAIALHASGLRIRPSMRMSWMSLHRRRWPPILLEFAVTGGTLQVAFLLVGAVAGITALGHMRAAQVLMGPVTILFQGSSAFVIPELIRRRAVSEQRAVRLLIVSVIGLIILAVGCGLLFWVLPAALGKELLGASWAPAHRLVPAVTVFAIFEAIVISMRSALRGWGIYKSGYRARMYMAPIVGVAVAVGAVVGRDVGAQWGIALANVIGAAIWVYVFGRAAPSAVTSLVQSRRISRLARSRRIATENAHGA